MADEKRTEGKWTYFTKTDIRIIKEAAKRKGLTVSSFIRMTVLDYMGRNNKPER